MREEKDARRGIRRDGGEGPVGYLAALLLCGVLAGAFVLSGLGGQVIGNIGAAVCKVARSGGLVQRCAPPPDPGGNPQAQDPDLPVTPCLAYSDTTYLEETLTIPTKRIDVRTNSRGTLQLNRLVGPDGRPTWQVVDFTWGEGGVATPEVGAGPVSGSVWGGVTVTNGKIYSGFRDEAEARRFFEDLTEHRIGNETKFTLRTNPLTGGFVWLGTKLPWVGDDFDRYMGGSEPDRRPTGEYLEGGVTGGFKVDIALSRVKIPLKGRGWSVNGSQTNLQNGEVTTYYNDRGEFEAAVQLDVGDIVRRLPPAVRRRAEQGLEDGLDAVMNAIETRLRGEYGAQFSLLPEHRAQMKAAIKVNPSIGFNYKHRGGTTWAITEDAQGNIVRVSQTQNGQDIVYARVDGKVDGGNSAGDRGQATAGKQWILFAQRTLTQKDLDYSRSEDRAVIDRFLGDGDTGALERAWENGVGTMGRTTYDNTGDTMKLEGKGASGNKPRTRWGIFEIGHESETHRLQSAHFYKPGTGWVPWTACR
ncbi:hypothetical protein ACQP1W_08890 [Spirillospora sp. CA-255316]